MKKYLSLTLFFGLLVWGIVMWPHPRLFTKAIPQSELIGKGAPEVVEMTPGDQIQLLYHFWLCGDMIKGNTPAFSNIYEYNIDGDDGKFRFDPYYIPFSLVYALFSSIGGDAMGWNCAMLFSHLLGLCGFFLLSRRFTKSNLIAALVAITASSFPYRWIALINGSPTGFAICLVPWIFYGIDRAVREASFKGSIIAGLALFFAYCSDLHVFYFSSLISPVAILISYLNSPILEKAEIKKRIISLIPFALLAIAAVAISMLSTRLGETSMAGGRTLKEIAILSPIASGIIRHIHVQGASHHIFIGYAAIVALFACFVTFAVMVKLHKNAKKEIILTVLLSLVALSVYSLALGVNGIFEGLPIRAARAVIPKYTMIRQPAKIFCIYPTIIVILATILLTYISSKIDRRKKIFFASAFVLCFAIIVERSIWFKPQFSRLPKTVPAFEAIAEQATEEKPKAICATLWPGDSHYSSLYEYGIMHSRLRLINGYSPAVPANYKDEIFMPLSSINEGHLSIEQLKLLLKLGVNYVIFYESPYLPKVAPFSGGVALQTLAANPNLSLIQQNNNITSFKIVSDFESRASTNSAGKIERSYLDYPAAFHWNRHRSLRSIDTAPEGMINLTLRAPVVIADDMRYLLFDRQKGWFTHPLTNPMGETFALPPDAKQIEHVLISAGKYPIDFTCSASISPARLFHTGSSNLSDQSVYFGKETTTAGIVMYGPGLPIPQGKYTLTITTKGDKGRTALRLYTDDGDARATYLLAPLASSQEDKLAVSFDHNNDRPFYLELTFHADCDLTVKEITLQKQP